jgi:hypothetical protein
MNKIKKSIAVFAALLLMSSNLTANNIKEADCEDQMDIFMAQAINSELYNDSELAWFQNGALAVYCYGYSWDDVINAK